jgi:hypothetical protein
VIDAGSELLQAVDAHWACDPRPPVDEDLLKLLHCPYKWGHAEACDPIAADDRRELQNCLFRMLPLNIGGVENPNSLPCLLIGLSRHVDWGSYPRNEDEAFHLAVAILEYLDCSRPRGAFDAMARVHVCNILNGWLKPLPAWESTPEVVAVCRLIFGDAWCELMLNQDFICANGVYRYRSGHSNSVAGLVSRQKPPFVPSLCADGKTLDHADLPSDIGL